MESDITMLLEASCDVLFLPSVSEVYPNGVEKLTDYDLGHLPEFLEGASRPGHFKGVANVVDRLVTLVKPDKIYLGQKDFQQVKVIERLAQLQQWKLEIVTCPIEREENGLAMSSRNVRLTVGQRENAALISKTLGWIQDHYREHNPAEIKAEAIQRINAIPEAALDYLEFCDTDRFQLIDGWKGSGEVVVVTAVKVGIVRLLDNVLLR